MQRVSLFVFLPIAILSFASPANADYVQIGAGPPLEVAKAICDNASMGVGQGYFAFGSQSYVMGAAIGNAIGNLIIQSRYKQNCLVMHGWKYSSGSSQVKAHTTSTYVRKASPVSRKCSEAQTMEQMKVSCR